ncbi:MAG: hypothetical protein MPL62_06075 [Alphaproteobacteria bacterium]|nr:hypothetical protein [Alphaproteobacteria bacterium]
MKKAESEAPPSRVFCYWPPLPPTLPPMFRANRRSPNIKTTPDVSRETIRQIMVSKK